PIQMDFLVARNVTDLRRLLDRVLGDAPILFSLLGNTLANFDADVELLRVLAKLAKPTDRFLLEVAVTDTLNAGALRDAANEYSNSTQFRRFVVSALLQNTDLHAESEEVLFIATAEPAGRAVRINGNYQNGASHEVKISLPDGNRVKFPPKDTIRLYLTRKYTDAGLGELVTEAGLVRLGNMRSGFDQNPVDPRRPHTTFGTELLLLAPTAASVNSA